MKKILSQIALLVLVTGISYAQQRIQNSVSGCPVTTARVDLDVNNVRAAILNGGDLWWDPVGQIPNYEVPKGSGKMSIYSGSIWIGGFDASNQLRTACQTYRQTGANDFWSGPISKDQNGTLNITPTRCLQYDQIWKITRSEVLNFIQNGTTTPAIVNWPGNGDVNNGELSSLAPYFDANNDGLYDYNDGDYPYFFFGGSYPIDPVTQQPSCSDYLFGDQSLWWIFNDIGNVKTETNSDAIGLEIRGQAFAFSSVNPAFNNATFYKYKIINRSNDSIVQSYLGMWCDPDLGDASDDYVGCDVGRRLAYVYNGGATDAVYGTNPPATGIDILDGPVADANDLLDNDHDGTTDEIGELITMTKFGWFSNINGSPTGNPAVQDDYYDYLSGYWKDGLQWTYGGDGRGGGTGATSSPTDFLFSENTDPVFTGFPTWTMSSSGIQPDDMRFLTSAGTFTLAPGAVQFFTTGVPWAQASSGGSLASLTLLKQYDSTIQTAFDNCFQVTGISDIQKPQLLAAWPNPFNEKCTIALPFNKQEKLTVRIYDILGSSVDQYKVTANNNLVIDGNKLKTGVYTIEIIADSENKYFAKIIKQ